MPRRSEHLPTVFSHTETDHHDTDYIKYEYIYCIHRTPFYFRPTRTHQGKFRENNIKTNQPQDVLIPLTSTPRTHGNNKDSTKDLHTVDIFEHKTLNLFQEFLSFLDEKIKNETTSHLTKHDKNIRPRQNRIPETQPNPNTQSSTSNQNIQDKMMLKLPNIQRQIERMRRVKKKQNQQQLHKKLETRTCFRCGKLGHVTKFCRSKPPSLYKFSTNEYSSPKFHLKQTLSRSRSHTKSYYIQTRPPMQLASTGSTFKQSLLSTKPNPSTQTQNHSIFSAIITFFTRISINITEYFSRHFSR